MRCGVVFLLLTSAASLAKAGLTAPWGSCKGRYKGHGGTNNAAFEQQWAMQPAGFMGASKNGFFVVIG